MHTRKRQLLVVSSGPSLAQTLGLRWRGDNLTVRHIPKNAVPVARTQNKRAALIVVDLCQEDASGLDLCDRLGAGKAAPLLFLLPRSDPLMAAAILDRGADDCLAKPFDPDELSIRIQAILRRADMPRGHPTIRSVRQPERREAGTPTVLARG